ncbi:MAG: T9SS type A sorting domain-containing protein [Bacteroidetes bacterium]|nr:T9SS type A sorting domain-containing protein [Bacteroidota bacterium]
MKHLKLRSGIFLIAGMLIFGWHNLGASHLFGGYFQYEFVSSTTLTETYKLTLTVYRDCRADFDSSVKVPFDKQITICAYNSVNELQLNLKMDLKSTRYMNPERLDSCSTSMFQCVELGVYSDTIVLNKQTGGYSLYWERCCRSIYDNLESNGGIPYMGATWRCYIPMNDFQNSNPVFNNIPYSLLCYGDTSIWNLNAVDKDGDSLSYKLVTPWDGASTADPIPDNCVTKRASAIRNVDYLNGFSPQMLFGSHGMSNLDNKNGDLTLISFKVGYFLGSTEVTEWRKGIAISTSRLEYIVSVEFPLSTLPIEKPKILLFPNPASETLKVSGLPDENLTWEVLDMRGAELSSGNANGDFIIETNNILNGIYILRISNGIGISNLKFAVQHI